MEEGGMECWEIFCFVLVHNILLMLTLAADDCNISRQSEKLLLHLCFLLHYFHNIWHLQIQKDIRLALLLQGTGSACLQYYIG